MPEDVGGEMSQDFLKTWRLNYVLLSREYFKTEDSVAHQEFYKHCEQLMAEQQVRFQRSGFPPPY